MWLDEMVTRILCNKKVPLEEKEKFYKTVFRPKMMYDGDPSVGR